MSSVTAQLADGFAPSARRNGGQVQTAAFMRAIRDADRLDWVESSLST
jgi:hypothetical protein